MFSTSKREQVGKFKIDLIEVINDGIVKKIQTYSTDEQVNGIQVLVSQAVAAAAIMNNLPENIKNNVRYYVVDPYGNEFLSSYRHPAAKQ